MDGMESPHKRRRLSPSASPVISFKSTTPSKSSEPSSTAANDKNLTDGLIEPAESSSEIRLTSEDEVMKLSSETSLADITPSAADPSSAVSSKSDDPQFNRMDSTEPSMNDDDPLAEIDFSLLSHTPNVDTQTNLALFDPSSMVLDFSTLDQSFPFELPAELESALASSAENGELIKAGTGTDIADVKEGAGLNKLLGTGNDLTGFLGGMASVSATPLGSPDLKALAESLVQDSPMVSPKPSALEKSGIISNPTELELGPIFYPKIEPTGSSILPSDVPSPLVPKDSPVANSPNIKSPLAESPLSAVSPSVAVPNRTSTPVPAVVTVRPTSFSTSEPKSISTSSSLSVPLVSSPSTNIIESSTSTQSQPSIPPKQSPAPHSVPSEILTKPNITLSKATSVVKKPVVAQPIPLSASTPSTVRPPIPTSVPKPMSTKSRSSPTVPLDDISLDANSLPPELMSFDFAALEASVLAGMISSEPMSGATASSTNTDAAGATKSVTTTVPTSLTNTQSLPVLPTLASTSSGAQSQPTPSSGPTQTSSTVPGPIHISRPIISQSSKTNQTVGTRSQTAPIPTLRTMNPAAYGRPPAQTVNLNTVLTGINSLLASPSMGQASAFSTVNPDMSTPGSMWSAEDRKHYLSLLPSSSLVQIILKLTETQPGLLAYPRALLDVVLQLEVQALKPKSGLSGGVGVGHRVGVAQSSAGSVGGQQPRYAARPGVQPGHQTGGVQGRPALYHPPGVRPVGVRPSARPVVGGPKSMLASNGVGGSASVRPSPSPLTPTARPRPVNPLVNGSIGRGPNPNGPPANSHNPSTRPSGLPHTIPKLAALHTSSPPPAGNGATSVRPKGAGANSPLGRPPGFHQAQGPGQAHGARTLHAAQAQAGMAALMSQLLPSRSPSPATGPTANGGKTADGNGTVPKGST